MSMRIRSSVLPGMLFRRVLRWRGVAVESVSLPGRFRGWVTGVKRFCTCPFVGASFSSRVVPAGRWSLTGWCESRFAFPARRVASDRAYSQSPSEECATVHWVLKDGEVKSVTERVGMNFLEIARKHEIDLEGACEGSLACSTCHIIIEGEDAYRKTGEPSDEENDMLDLAFGLTETSRLGCQVILTRELDGVVVRIPTATRNMMVDGHVPRPH